MEDNDDKFDLTSSTFHWKNNAMLRPYGNATWNYAEGFRLLGEIGATYVMETHRNQDMLVFPILYAYRHYIELECKRILGMYRWGHNLDNPFVTGHKLSVLWPQVRPIILDINNGAEGDPEMARADRIVAQFQEWDDAGTAFRYTDDIRTKSNSLPGLTHIGIDTVKVEMEKLRIILEGADTSLGEWLDNIGKGWA